MLMLGSSFTGDYQQMARRVQDGIVVKKLKRSDENLPQHLLPYRDHLLPKEHRHDAKGEGNERGEGSDHRDSDQSRAPTPHNAGTPRASSSESKKGGRSAASTPHIPHLSFTGGLGLEDTTDYAAMSRRRPEKGLVGKPITFMQLGLFDKFPEHERLQLLSCEQQTAHTARDTQTPRARKDGRVTPRGPHPDGLACPPKTPRDDLRPRTSAGLMQRESELGTLGESARSLARPESAQVGTGAARARPEVTPRGHRKSESREEGALTSGSLRAGHAAEERCLSAREAPRQRTSATVFEPKTRAPDCKKNNVFGGVALSADMPRHPVTGILTERKTHAEITMKAEWEKYLSRGEHHSVLHDADALRARNRAKDVSAAHAIQKLESFLARMGVSDDMSNPGGNTAIHGPSQTPRAAHTPRATNTPRDGGTNAEGAKTRSQETLAGTTGGGKPENRWGETRDTRAQTAVAKLTQILRLGGDKMDRGDRGLLSARGERGPPESPLGPAPPKTARPDLGKSVTVDRQNPPGGSSSPAIRSPANSMMLVRSTDRAPGPSASPTCLRKSGSGSARRTTGAARPLAQELKLAKTTLGFMETSGSKISTLGGPRSIASARRAVGTR